MATSKHILPTDPKLAAEFAQLDYDAKEFFQERAAIIEYDGGLSRLQAEANAMVETREYVKERDAEDGE